jgi:hypothetical protein
MSHFTSSITSKSKLDSFVANLEIPTYMTFTKYHYWDFLMALSKKHFSKDTRREWKEIECVIKYYNRLGRSK